MAKARSAALSAAEEAKLEQPLPSGASAEEVSPEALAEALATDKAPSISASAREYVVLNGPASFGPVIVNGQTIRAKAGELYHIPNAEERADVLATGVFRGVTAADVKKAGVSSAGTSGAVTRESLPPGALKGGLLEQKG
ncbi:MAG: hypothetical protein M1325_04390 [Actinobacteria bacterium]|nr:hypothetical protein [Actinomycetota bacterium]